MIKVLCVDDEELLLEELTDTVREVLPDADITATNVPADAIFFSRTNFVDTAFLDIDLDTTSGIEIAKKLQKVNPRVNIIFCTGYSEYALDALDINCSGYVMKPITVANMKKAVANLRFPLQERTDLKLRINCFGNFGVSYGGNEVRFKYNKSREMLAYLVDRNGSPCSKGEIAAALFEDDEHGAYMAKIRKDLIDTLTGLGVNVLSQQKGTLSIKREEVSCDYFDFLDNKPGAAETFRGEYMTQYSWGESTLAMLER